MGKVKNFSQSAKTVLTDRKQYLSFFLALLVIQTLFWTLTITTGINNRHAHETLTAEYKYHVIISDLDAKHWNNLYNVNSDYKEFKPDLWPQVDKIAEKNDGFGEITVTAGVILKNSDSSFAYFKEICAKEAGISASHFSTTPLFDDDPLMSSGNETAYTVWCIVFFVVAVISAIIHNKTCHPKLDDGTGERIYRTTTNENINNMMRGISLAAMIISGVLALVFFILLISIGNGTVYFFLYLFLFTIAAAFMTELFNIRINHHKFRYGIYMTFGAGFEKLYATAVVEMLIVSAIALVPSFAISMGTVFLLYRGLDVTVFLPPAAVVSVIVIDLIIVFASTYIPMQTMAVKPPITLLYAEDNSNLVTSPRRSFKIFGKSFPWAYEAYGMWRFRKYFVRLTAIAVSFTTIFLCGIYLAGGTPDVSDADVCEFSVKATGESLTAEEMERISGALSEDAGFGYLYWSDAVSASSLKAHALVNSGNVLLGSNVYDIPGVSGDTARAGYRKDGFTGTTDSFCFTAYNKTLIASLDEMYEVEGDPGTVLSDRNKIIVSNYLNSIKCFDFKPGDKIVIAVPDFVTEFDSGLVAGGRYDMALKKLIGESSFFYREYEVAATVDYGAKDGRFLIGMNENEFSSVIQASGGKIPSLMREISVFTDRNASAADFERLLVKLNDEFGLYDYAVTETYGVIRAKLYGEGAHHAIIIAVSLLIMLVSPIMWFFSQRNFFKRRSKEMFVLRALGGREKEIRKLYLASGLILSGISAVMTLAMSYIADFLIYIFSILFLADGSAWDAAVGFYMPPEALIACIAVALLCGFLSSLLPYLLGRGRKKDLYNIAEGERNA